MRVIRSWPGRFPLQTYLPRGQGVHTPKPDAGVASKRPNSQSKRNLARPGLGVAGPWSLAKPNVYEWPLEAGALSRFDAGLL